MEPIHILQQGAQKTAGGSVVQRVVRYKFLVFLFLTPLFFLPLTLSPVTLNKQLFAGVVALSFLVYVLAFFLARGKMMLPRSATAVSALIFLGTIGISTALSSARLTSVFSTSGDSLFWVAVYVISFLLVLFFLDRKEWVVNSAVLLFLSVSLLAIYGLLQLSGVFIFPLSFTQSVNFNPIGSPFLLAFVAGGMFVALVSFISFSQAKLKYWFEPYIMWALAGLFVLLLVHVNLWTLWLAVVVALAVALVIALYRNIWQARGAHYSLRQFMMPLFIIIAAMFFVLARPSFPSFLTPLTEVSPSASATFDVAKSALISKDFAFGTGPGTFGFAYSEHKPLIINQTLFWGVQFAQGFSPLLSYLTTWGVLGMLAFLAFVGLVFKTGLQHFTRTRRDDGDDTRKIRAVGLASFTAFTFFVAGFILHRGDPVLLFALFVSAGIAVSSLRVAGVIRDKKIDITQSSRLLAVGAVASILIISSAAAGIYALGTRYIGEVVFSRAVNGFAKTGDVTQTLTRLNSALSYNNDNDQFLRVSSQALMVRVNEIINDPNLSNEDRANLLNTTVQNAATIARRATVVNPAEVQNWIQLGVVYEKLIGLVQDVDVLAADAYGQAALREPTNPFLRLTAARAYIAAGRILQSRGQNAQAQEKFDLAIIKLDEALELKNDYAAARFLLVFANDLAGNVQQAISEARQVLAADPRDVGALLQLGLLQYRTNDFTGAKATLERLLTVQANNADGRYMLGITEARLGNTSEALRLFTALAKENPNNVQVAQILNNLQSGRAALANIDNPLLNPVTPASGGGEEPILP